MKLSKIKFIKKTTIFFLSLFISIATYSQHELSDTLSKPGYLREIKKEKKIAWISSLAGTAIFTTGVIIQNNKGSDKPNILEYIGLTPIYIGVRFFIDAGHDKKKMRSLYGSIKTERMDLIYRNAITKLNYPAISLRIDLLQKKG